MTRLTFFTGLFALTLLLITSSCQRKGCTDPEALNYDEKAAKDDGTCIYPLQTGAIEFQFDHEVDGEALQFNTSDYAYTNDAGNAYKVERLKYYISDIWMHREDGEAYHIDDWHYRNGEDAGTREFFVTNIPAGTYTAISFVFGLDSIKNKTGYLPNTQVHNNMEWPEPMGGGYHYMKLEGKYEDPSSSSGEASFNLHTGRLGTDSAIHENFVVIHQEDNIHFTVDNDTWEAHFVMNLNEWFRNPNVYDFETYGAAIMGNQTAQQELKENGQSVFTLHHVTQIDDGHNHD